MLAFLSFKLGRILGVRPVIVNLVLLHLLIGIGLTAYSSIDDAGVAQPTVVGIFILMYVVLVGGVVGLGRLASRNFFRKPDEWEDV
ncbi:MAG: hypothetical protein QF414_02435 [Arenicellales bacterium]|nr:hypothetical protein [Arenicellales bacterium]